MAYCRTNGNGNSIIQSYQIMIAVSQVCFMMYYGMGAAVSVRISNFYGQGDIDNVRRTANHGFHIILVMLLMTGIPIFLLRNHIGGWFTDSEEVSRMVASVIYPFLLYQFGDALQINFANSLRGIADVKPMLLYAFIAYFVISLPAGYHRSMDGIPFRTDQRRNNVLATFQKKNEFLITNY